MSDIEYPDFEYDIEPVDHVVWFSRTDGKMWRCDSLSAEPIIWVEVDAEEAAYVRAHSENIDALLWGHHG